jgi:glycosyltransferase involved in cell wall biosynthesis
MTTSATIIIPCLNEAKSLGTIINECKEAIAQDLKNHWRILIVDNGSTDNSKQVAIEAGIKVLTEYKKGYGNALHTGILQAETDYIIYFDADGTYCPRQAINLVEVAKQENADLVIGSRINGSIEAGAMPNIHRYFGTPLLSGLIRFLSGSTVIDNNSGMRCIKRESYLAWNLSGGGMEFASSMIIAAVKNNSKIIETPISYKQRIDPKGSHLRTWRDGFAHLNIILKKALPLWLRRSKFSLLWFFAACFLVSTFFKNTQLLSDFNHGFSPHIAYRMQTESLLKGKTNLFSTPFPYTHDSTWAINGVEQQWGLGIPLLRLPFEVIAKIFGYFGFPDRILLLVFTFLCFFILGRELIFIIHPSIKTKYAFLFYLVILQVIFWNTPFLSLAGSRFKHYEEAVYYLILASFSLLALLLMFQRKPTKLTSFFICAMAGLSILIRPTCFFYAIASIIVLTLQKESSFKQKIFNGISTIFIFSIFISSTLITNYYRFANPFEFGHSFNIALSELNGYALRFNYPFQNESIWSASKELFSAIFSAKIFNYDMYYSSHILPFQSPTIRYREFYFNTFSPITAILLLLGLSFITLCKLQKNASSNHLIKSAFLLAYWGITSFVLLFIFYLHAPSISSRYVMDFYPSICIILVAALLLLADLIQKFKSKLLTIISLFMLFAIFVFNSTLENNPISLSEGKAYSKKDLLDSKSVFDLTQNILTTHNQNDVVNIEIPEILCKNQIFNYTYPDQMRGWYSLHDCRVAVMTQVFINKSPCYKLYTTFNQKFLTDIYDTSYVLDPQQIRMKVNEIDYLLNKVWHEGDQTIISFCQTKPSAYKSHISMLSIAWLPELKPLLTPIILHKIEASSIN